jgi:histidyl-tRNA synthetase
MTSGLPSPSSSSGSPGAPGPRGQHAFQAPTGTRDFYPADLSRLRFIQDAWRRTAVAHGFEEIDGPTFEHLEVYTAKSGEGIVSELFSFQRAGGEKTLALRPEFTPTLARMYAARANALPRPTKWFWMQNCFRAERPQRGRLREFTQWNCDVIGDDSPQADAEVIACAVGMFEGLGLTPEHVRIRVNDRNVMRAILEEIGIPEPLHGAVADLLDRRAKLSPEEFAWTAGKVGVTRDHISAIDELIGNVQGQGWHRIFSEMFPVDGERHSVGQRFFQLAEGLDAAGLSRWWTFDPAIVRGLAYYTGMVFEVHEASGAERAIAGGGRYDGLIELFGGPPTPAVGFGMGDVVLSLVLQDKGLMPSDDEVADRLGLRPDAVVVSAGATPEDQAAAAAAVAPTLAALRRAGLHARRSYKATKNVGKLIQDAAKQRARFCVILEGATTATLKDLSTQGQQTVPVAELAARLARPPR